MNKLLCDGKRCFSKSSSYWVITFIAILLNIFPLSSQEGDTNNDAQDDTINNEKAVQREDLISVFLDCDNCDRAYIRQQLDFVNYARDPELGQVHLFVTDQGTASGGRIFTLSFMGRETFDGISNTLTYTSNPTNTRDEEREGLNEMIKLGLVPYIAQTSLVEGITVDIAEPSGEQISLEDPWNNWIFEVYGDVDFDKELSRGSLDIRYGFYVDYVTKTWRIRLRPYFNYNEDTYEKDEKDVLSVLHRNGFEGRVIRSISSHWSVGSFADVISSTSGNIGLGYRIAPAIEYSLLPYELALRKEYTIAYSVGYLHRRYLEETIYGKIEESLYNHSLKLDVRLLQPWGSVRAGLEGSHYFHDPSKNRFSFDSRLSVRIFKGLSIDFYSDLDFVRDQLSLPKGDASLEEVLLGQRDLATNYEVSVSFGFRYQFGSIYNNVVNTRL